LAPLEGNFSDVFASASTEHQVPEKLLLALAYEASHWNADVTSAWGGVGLFDLREEGVGPTVESAAIASGIDPDTIIASPRAQVKATAALLADHARRANDGELPAADDLIEWWDAIRAFSGSMSPIQQDRFAAYVYEQVNFGIERDEDSGLELRPEPVDHWSRVPVVPPASNCDYADCAQFVPADSSNYSDYSRTASDIDLVVMHTVQGSYSSCINWFQNSAANVSAHYVVQSSDGEVTQMLLEEDVGWHAGNWDYNLASVGIEHEGYVDEWEDYYTEEMYQSSAALTADILDRNGIPVDRDHVIGHDEVPGSTHTDPGEGWDWDYYMELVAEGGSGGGTSPSTGDIIGVIADSDIYNGDRLSDAVVWLEETGESTVSASDGYYYFYDLSIGTYTVHACLDGYAEATCETSISTGDNWCSIALEPGDGDCSVGGDTGTKPTDSGDVVEGDSGVDTGTGDLGPSFVAGSAPGDRVPMNDMETKGCGCSSGPIQTQSAPRTWLLGGLMMGLVVTGRRRRADLS